MPNFRQVRRPTPIALALAAALCLALSAQATPRQKGAASAASRPAQDTSSAIVQLVGEPLATYEKTRPAQGRKIEFNANSVKAYRAQLAALRNSYKAWLRANVPAARITGNFDIALNAVSVQLNGATLNQIAASPLVRRAEFSGL